MKALLQAKEPTEAVGAGTRKRAEGTAKTAAGKWVIRHAERRIPLCSIRGACIRYSSGISRGIRRRWWSAVAACPKDVFLRCAETFANASGPDKTAAICYAVGWTQHSKGVQVIRSAAILQLLLGNIGRPGGGILALRGHASIQGSTDIPTLYDILPGYLPMPFFEQDSKDLAGHIRKHKTRTGMWSELRSVT